MNSNVSRTQVREELRKQWSARAVEMALSGDWEGALRANQQILELFPDDVRTYNRLGKAYMELSRLQDALSAYEETLKRQPSNSIARKRLSELYALLEKDPSSTLAVPSDIDAEDEEGADDDDEGEEEEIEVEDEDLDEDI